MAVEQLLPAGSLGDAPDLERLSGPGIRAFFKLGEAWGLTVDEQRQLLGGISKSTYHRWKKERDALLSIDQLERISHLLGIYKSLQILLPASADTWVRSPNANPLFRGRPAIQVMVQGGISALKAVRAHLDAQRGGWA
jgi:uncharacterized protein (DUF2384 family)